MTKQQLKASVRRARAGRARGKFSVELKSAIADYCRSRRAEGAGWRQLSDELGVGETQVLAWCRGRRVRPKSRLKPVEVVDESTPAGSSGPRLNLPGGAVVTGLSLEDVATLARALR